MDRELVLQLFLVATFIGLLPSVVAFIRWSGPAREQRYLRVLVWTGTAVGIAAHIMGRVFGTSNLFLLHFYTIFDFTMITLIFQPFLSNRFSKWAIGIFAMLALINSVFIEQLNTFNVVARSIAAFVIMCYVLRYFWVTLQEMNVRYLERQPIFWISCGAILYYAAGFFIFIFSNDLLPHDDLWWTYWGVHAIFTIILYSFYSIALWVRPKP